MAGRYVKTPWKDVQVGDMIHLSCNEMIPADILVLRSSDEHGLCYIDTQNLDGEANLKQREVPRGFVERVCFFKNTGSHNTWDYKNALGRPLNDKIDSWEVSHFEAKDHTFQTQVSGFDAWTSL
jgi:magnesium-transporting ATPase (P-type)